MKLFKSPKNKTLRDVTLNPFTTYTAVDFMFTEAWTSQCHQFESAITKKIASFGSGLDQYSGAFDDREIDATAKVEKDKLAVQLQKHKETNLEISIGTQSELKRLQAEKALSEYLFTQLTQLSELATQKATTPTTQEQDTEDAKNHEEN